MKWIKLATDIFEDEKLMLIAQMEDSTPILLCWVKLLCLAGKQDNRGIFLLGGRTPYTPEMLAAILRMDEHTVRRALGIFQSFGMIAFTDGVLTIPNWNKHQSLTAYERKLAYDREYRKRQRQEQKTREAPPGETKAYGCCNNVMLTDTEYAELQAEYPDDHTARLDRLSQYMAATGRRYENHLAVIRKWAREDAARPQRAQRSFLELLQEEP